MRPDEVTDPGRGSTLLIVRLMDRSPTKRGRAHLDAHPDEKERVNDAVERHDATQR